MNICPKLLKKSLVVGALIYLISGIFSIGLYIIFPSIFMLIVSLIFVQTFVMFGVPLTIWLLFYIYKKYFK